VLSLAFKVTNGGAATAGVAASPDAVVLVAVRPDVFAFELAPHAASALSTVNTKIDFNANANLEQRLRRIEIITRLPKFSMTVFSAALDSIRPQSLRSHIQSIFLNRQPVAICKLHMLSDANKFIRVFENSKLAREKSRRASATTIQIASLATTNIFFWREMAYKLGVLL